MKKLFTFLLLLFAVISFSQWNSNIEENLAVTSLKSQTNTTKSTSDGKTYVFFYEIGAVSQLVPRVQLLDQSGNKLFGDNGIVIYTEEPGSQMTSTQPMDLVVDQEDNLIVTFVAWDNKLHAFKISSEGTKLWGDNGVEVAGVGASFPKILPLTSGVVITYENLRAANLMKLNAQNGEKLWETSKIINNVGGFTRTAILEFAQFSDDSFIAVLQGRATNFTNLGKLYAQRYDADGVALWDAMVEIHSSAGVTKMNRYDYFLDENENFYFNYNSNLDGGGTKYDAFVQKISSEGEIPWGVNGQQISMANYTNETNPYMAQSGEMIWAVATVENGSDNKGILVQKINKETGDLVFGTDGTVVYTPAMTNSGAILISGMSIVDSTPVFLVAKTTDISVSPFVLKAVTLTSEGEILAETPLTAPGRKNNIKVSVYGGQLVATWQDFRVEGDEKIYAQNLIVETETFSVDDSNAVIDIMIYPNPVSTVAKVLTTKNIINVQVYDSFGQILLSTKEKEISLKNLKSGVYIFKITLDNGASKSIKIIKK